MTSEMRLKSQQLDLVSLSGAASAMEHLAYERICNALEGQCESMHVL